MKILIFILCLISPLALHAQQPPKKLLENHTGLKDQVPEYVNEPIVESVPRHLNVDSYNLNIIKAQTQAINALATEIDELKARITRLEEGNEDGE